MAKAALMAEAINGAVLKWAREKLGYDRATIAMRLDCSPEQVQAWEEGKALPTFAQAETLAYTIYKRPLAVFYLPEAPKEAELREDFRVLPEAEVEKLAADTRYKVRLAHSNMLALRELNDGRNPAEIRIFEQIKLKSDAKVVQSAELIRQQLGITLQQQVAWSDPEAAFKAWREAVESRGIYVFKHSFKQKSISGFCLWDDQFPVIFINNSTPPTRQVFTLAHELAHVLLGLNSLSLDDWEASRFDPQAKAAEVFCNALAAEILVPSGDFNTQAPASHKVDGALVERLSHRYRVSRETVLRRFLDRGRVTPAIYQRWAAEWAKQAVQSAGKKKGGDYYRTQHAYLGDAFLKLVFARHYQGRISLEQAAEYLGVKAKNLSSLEATLFSGAAAR